MSSAFQVLPRLGREMAPIQRWARMEAVNERFVCVPLSLSLYIYIYILYIHTKCMCIYIYICKREWSGVWRFQPPPSNGMVWQGLGGGGGLACAERGRGGWVGCCWGGAGVTERAGILRNASHKPDKVGHVPVFIELNLYLIL